MEKHFRLSDQGIAHVLSVALILILSACSVSPVIQQTPDTEAWQTRQVLLSSIDHWKMQGRLAIETKEDSGTAAIIWEQKQKDFRIRITAPMGQGVIILDGNDESVQLRDGQGHTMIAESAEQLLWEHTGWQIPLRGLRHWVLGLNSSQNNEMQIDGAGQLLAISADGWVVQYSKYAKLKVKSRTFALPSKMELENENMKIKLSINDWQTY